jgi:lysophospholipase L1-like esterase
LWGLLTAAGIKSMFVGNGAAGDADVSQRWMDGLVGDTIAQMTARALVSLPVHCPEVLLIHGGTNDNQTGRTAAQALADLDILLGQAWTSGQRTAAAINRLKLIEVALIGDLPGNKQMTLDFNAGIPALVAAHVALGRNIKIVDMFSKMGANPGVNWNAGSTPHPSVAGYQVMAAQWFGTPGSGLLCDYTR